MKVAVAHESSPMVGETANGDRAVFIRDAEDRVLVSVIDGLGHGPEAALVAQAAATRLGELSLAAPILDIMEALHDRLRGSRGAAATVCVFRGREVEACAVGNVELRGMDFRLPLISSAGIVGVRVAKFHTCRATVLTSARLVLFSDGISSRVPLDDVKKLGPAAACAEVMRKYRRKEDDATVLVADIG